MLLYVSYHIEGKRGFSNSGIKLYVLLSLYLCFISFLYLDLYVLGDDAWISYGSFMPTKHLCLDPHLN